MGEDYSYQSLEGKDDDDSILSQPPEEDTVVNVSGFEHEMVGSSYSYHSSKDKDDVDSLITQPQEDSGSCSLYSSSGEEDEEMQSSHCEEFEDLPSSYNLRPRKTKNNEHILSSLHLDFVQTHPEIKEPIKRIISCLLTSKTRLPNEEGEGIVLKSEAPYNENNKQINVDRPVPIKEMYGSRAKDNDVESDETDNLYSYATGSGTVTTGTRPRYVTFAFLLNFLLPISPYTMSTFLLSQFVVKAFNEDIQLVGSAIHKFLLENQKDHKDVTIKELNSMVFLAYTQKTAINWHTDQRYSSNGSFMESQNSQEENTFVCVLTIGDTRKLNMRCVRCCRRGESRDVGDPPVGPIPVEAQHSFHAVLLPNGSLFLLHPKDEVPFLRENFDSESFTFFQHCAVYSSKDGLSIALVFRTTSHTVSVLKNTGLASNYREFSSKDERFTQHLLEYSSSDKRRMFEENMKRLYLNLEETYLKKF
jgi:hypothetical protein